MTGSKSKIKTATDYDREALIKILDMAWGNIQHNETFRNRSFELYIALVAGLILVIDYRAEDIKMRTAMLTYSLLVTILGFFTLWTIVRLRAMIARDVAIIRKINDILSKSWPILSKPLDIYSSFFISSPRPIFLSRWTTTSSDLAKISIISSGISALSIWLFLRRTVDILLIVFLSILLIQWIFVQGIKKLTPSHS